MAETEASGPGNPGRLHALTNVRSMISSCTAGDRVVKSALNPLTLTAKSG